MMHEIKTMTIYFYNSFYNGYCSCHVPCVNFFLLSLFLFFMYERIFYLQETIYRIANSKRKHQHEMLSIASLWACTRCVPISNRHTKRATYFVTLQDELNSDEKNLATLFVARQLRMSVVKYATSLYSSFCLNVAKQVAPSTVA